MAGLWLFAAIGMAALLGLPRRIAALMALALWLGIVALHGAAPGSRAAAMAGGDIRVWLLLGGIVALILGYRAVLRRLGAHAITPEASPPAPDVMSDTEIERYARHLVLRDIGGAGQQRLRDARVLIVGAGGLGAPVGLYLAAAGVGRITIADGDTVGLSNLQRQVIFRSDQCGQGKARAAAANLGELNPHVRVTPIGPVTPDDAALIAAHDLVLDGTDSHASREIVNRLCVQAGVPLIAGSIAQWDGQVTLYDPARGGPCMACLFPQAPDPALAPPCAEVGVIGPLPGVIGSMMAMEAIKHLTGAGQGLRGRMLIFDGLYGESRMIGVTPRKACDICGCVNS